MEPDLFSYRSVETADIIPAPVAPRMVAPPMVPPPVADRPESSPASIPRPAPIGVIVEDRPLIVVLADEAFAWFRAGEKTWELRRRGRQFNENEVIAGREVSLYRGFRSDGGMTGRIDRVSGAASVEAFFEAVPYHDVVPVAESRDEAVAIAKRLLGPGSATPVIGFRIEVDRQASEDGENQVMPKSPGKRPSRGL
jgi:hypothetical protein